ncbi:MAG: preprotein translocase subunit YajC [Chloroflexi bacterium]|nr:preprotein translocase subunit YajC [Chloroflexota bacterium]MCC6893495.1 preprotein translocase subunit YajC [Anaerolineae bacterium]
MEFVLLALVMLLGLGAYWAMVIFPKQRDFSKRQRYVRSLAAGDEVVTYGGIIGKVLAIDAEKGVAQVEIADGVVVRLVTAALVQAYDPEVFAEAARKGLGEAEPAPSET